MSVSIAGADEYLGARLDAETWTGETEERKGQALRSAEDIIVRYQSELDSEGYDAAVYEQALFMLGSRYGLQSQGVVSFSLSGISESYDLKGRPAELAPSAWRIIKAGGLSGSSGRRSPIFIC